MDRMDGFSNNNNDAFDRNFGRINPYAEKYGTQNPQETGFNPQMRPQQDPRVAPRPQMQTPYPQYNPYQAPQQPIQQQVPPQFVQQQGQISQQDFEDQFDYSRSGMQPIGMQMPPQQMVPPQPIQQPQPKKRGLFSFMSKKQEPVVQQPMYAQQFVNLQTPQSINDIKGIINMLKAGDTVLVDFSRASDQQSQRMLDFLAGASFALGGLMQQMGEKKFILTPPGTGIRGQLDK